MFRKLLKKYTVDPFFQLGDLDLIYNYAINQKVEMSHELLNKFFLFSESDKCKAAFYPSSGEDTSDIKYFNQIDFTFSIEKPNLFIHTDSFIAYEKMNNLYLLQQNDIIKNGIRLLYNTETENEICYLLEIENDNNINWLILFSGKVNEDMIKEIVRNKFKIPFLYSKCDGILSGMGGIGIENPIGVAFYIYLYELLGTKYHLTEFTKLWFNDFVKNDSRLHNQKLVAKRMYKKLTGTNWDDQIALEHMLDNIDEFNQNVEDLYNMTLFSIKNQ